MPATGNWRCQCGAVLSARSSACSECGTVKPVATTTPARRCPFDGGEFDALGFCARGNGFPWPLQCPFVCPHCRGPLAWNGGCDRCRGSDTPEERDTWTFTGDYYEPVGDRPTAPTATTSGATKARRRSRRAPRSTGISRNSESVWRRSPRSRRARRRPTDDRTERNSPPSGRRRSRISGPGASSPTPRATTAPRSAGAS